MPLLASLLAALFTVVVAAPAQAQTPPANDELPPPTRAETLLLRFHRLNVEDGLAQGSIYSILQDRRGYLWFGTQHGMSRYDGYAFKNYGAVAFDTTALLPEWITDIAEDRDGVLWVVSRHQGLSRFDPVTETATHYRHDPDDPNSLPDGLLSAALETRDGAIWVGSSQGLSRMDPAAPGHFTHYRHDPDDPTSLSNNLVWQLFEDTAGTLWVVTANGLCRMDVATPGQFTRYLTGPGGPDEASEDQGSSISAIYEDPRAPGVMWVGTRSGLVRLDRETGTVRRYDPNPDGPRADWVRGITADPEERGVLWIVVRDLGVARFDVARGAFTVYEHDPRDPHSLSSNKPVRILTDRTGVVWVGHDSGSGISRFDPAAVGFQVLRHDPDDPRSLAEGGVWGIHEDRAGQLWVGARSRNTPMVHLHRIDRATGEVRRWATNLANPPGQQDTALPSGRVVAIIEDQAGYIWLGGDSGLDRYDPATGRFTHYRHDPTDPSTLSDPSVYGLVESEDGTLWIATFGPSGGGVDRYDPATGTFTPLWKADSPGSSRGGLTFLLEDQAGILWGGVFGEGVVRLDPATGEATRFEHDPADTTSITSSDFYAMVERDKEPGVLWLGSSNSGLTRLDTRTGLSTHYTTEDGLPDNTFYGLLEDDEGMLWMTTNRGISRFDPDTEAVRTFGLDAGVQALEFDAWATAKGRYGELFFGGVNGLNAFYPSQITANETPPQVALTGFRLFNKPVTPSPNGPLKTALAETDEIRLSHDQNHVDFDYVALHFKNPEENAYAYRLEGFDDDWIEAGTDRRATYTNLPPGDYTFRMKATNSDGVWNEEGASVKLTVLPPWWRTWWAYAIYGLLFLTGVFAVDRGQRRRLIAREREKARERELAQARKIETAHAELQQAHMHLRATQAQLVQQEKMASLGQLTAGIAHEIKNPLNFVNNFAEVNQELAQELREALANGEDVDDLLADLEQNASVIVQHGKRADGIVHAMMQHASGGTGQREATDVNALVAEYIDLAYHGKRAQRPELQVEIDRDLGADVGRVEMVPQEIGRVLLNLLGNAFDAVHEKMDAETRGHGDAGSGYAPTVTVSTRRVDNGVEIRVADNGPGIPKDFRQKIFEPFFTTKPTGSGTGLGLSLSYDIVTQGHSGRLTVEGENGQGTAFVVTLPTSR